MDDIGVNLGSFGNVVGLMLGTVGCPVAPDTADTPAKTLFSLRSLLLKARVYAKVVTGLYVTGKHKSQ